MTLLEATNILAKKYPGRVVTGYWVNGKDYILNTKLLSALQGVTAPGQFVVTEDGNVYGTNPVRSNLDISDMKTI